MDDSQRIYWQSVSFSSLRVEEWDEEFIVFQPDSGKTHFLNQMGMQILVGINQSPASVDEICEFLAEQFKLTSDQIFSQQIIKTLHRFEELGLIKSSRRESAA